MTWWCSVWSYYNSTSDLRMCSIVKCWKFNVQQFDLKWWKNTSKSNIKCKFLKEFLSHLKQLHNTITTWKISSLWPATFMTWYMHIIIPRHWTTVYSETHKNFKNHKYNKITIQNSVQQLIWHLCSVCSSMVPVAKQPCRIKSAQTILTGINSKQIKQLSCLGGWYHTYSTHYSIYSTRNLHAFCKSEQLQLL